jgi:hypothetical protein
MADDRASKLQQYLWSQQEENPCLWYQNKGFVYDGPVTVATN